MVLAHPDIEKRDVDTVGENERVGRIGRIALKHMHYHMQKRSLRGSCWKAQEAQPGACDDQEGWDEVGGAREVQEEGHMCIPVAGLYCRMVDASIAL